MIGSYGSGSNKGHTEEEIVKARQALSLLKANRAKGETAAQKIGTRDVGKGYEPPSSSSYKKPAAYEPKPVGKAGNTNYRKVFNPKYDDEEEEEKRAPAPPTKAARLQKVSQKYGMDPSMSGQKPMSNLANLGKKALNSEVVSNEFGMRPPVKNPIKRPEVAKKQPVTKGKPPSREIEHHEIDDIPIRPTKGGIRPPLPKPKPTMNKKVVEEDGFDDIPIRPAKGGMRPPIPKGRPQIEEDDDRPIKPIKGMMKEPMKEEDDYTSAAPTGVCRFCERKFNPESLVKHQKVCQDRPDKKKRKVFDSKKARIVSEEQKKLQAANKKIENKAPAKKMPKWKIQSAQFRNAIKGSSSKNDGPGSNAVQAEADERSYYTQCPTCGRSFNDEAAKRHIPFCANKAKLDAMKSGGKGKAAPPQNRRKY